MKKYKFFNSTFQLSGLILMCTLIFTSCSAQSNGQKKESSTSEEETTTYNKLTAEEAHVILDKGTDRAFTGEYTDKFDEGVYQCRQCNAPLYVSDDKFHSNCGWPSFDQEIKGAVTSVKDADGRRTEITCANCKGHLGHVFYGEGFTEKDTRHCVNTTSLIFVPKKAKGTKETAIFAGGCFWGVEYYFQNEPGVLSTQVGYTGGHTKNPTYQDVLSHKSGHYEAIEITYDASKTSYETLAKLFFEIHDPTQANGQGNDIGQQYESVVFYNNDEQKNIANRLIQQLKKKGFKVATKLIPATTFWSAEQYHQAYYEKGGGTPYCHKRVKRF
jgi:peptide methionine sulfoxide reductase msrA/msrB